MIKKIIAAFASNTVFANIVLAIIFLAGFLAMNSMSRETFPEFSLDIITITVPYPGADPEEIEEGISQKIETAIEGIEGIKLYTTWSSEGAATAVIELKENYENSDVLDKVRSKVESISNFPRDAEKPVINELMLKDSVISISLSGNMSERQLKEWAERIKDEIQHIPSVTQVNLFGTRDYEISIELSEEKLRQYGLSIAEVANTIRQSNLNQAGGTIRTKGEEIRLRTIGRRYTGQDLASIVVLAGPAGDIITLDRIAKIKDGFIEDPVTCLINGKPAILVLISKTKEEDALTIANAVHNFVTAKKKQLPETANIGVLYDSTDMLRSRIDLLTKNGQIGLILVCLLLWAFLDLRLAFWGAMGIPISIAGALAILWALGATINMISLFGLIMVLGIVVDDAIVVGEAIFTHRQRGEPPLQAAIEGVHEVGMPVLAAIITTIIAFIPLMYIGGIMGKFIAIMPVVVIASLVISLIECIFLLPAHLSHLPEQQDKQATSLLDKILHLNKTLGHQLSHFIQNVYLPFLKKVLRWRYISFCTAIMILLLCIGFIRSGILKFEVFPEVDGFVITANVEFAQGTPPEITKAAVDQIDQALVRLAAKTKTASGEPLIKNRLILVGQELKDYGNSGPHLGGVQVILLESDKRGIHTKDLMTAWEEEVGAIAGIQSLTFQGLAHGPPGDPIEIWIQGWDMTSIIEASEHLMQRLKQFDGVTQVRSDYAIGKNEIRLTLRPEARSLGLTVEDLARQINGGYFGAEAVRLQRGSSDLRIKVRYDSEQRHSFDLEKIRIRTKQGIELPLRTVALLKPAPGYSTIIRTNGMRRIMVSAGINTKKANANEIIAELSTNYFPILQDQHPELLISAQGEQKKMRESFNSLLIGFPLAILGVFVIIATIFRSYIQPFIIMFTVPFGIIGAVIGHLVLGYDLSMMSLFGMVALTGVVVNDAIVLIERINNNLGAGIPFIEALLQGGKRRFRAIFLTTLSTVGGLSPLIMETDLQAKFLIPMALSIAAGVLFATLLTLLLIPSLLLILNDLRCMTHFLTKGIWPTREEVEPAASRNRE